MWREHGARSTANRVGGSERLRRIDVDRRLEAAREHELGQRLEVDHVRSAGEHEYGVGRHELEQLA